MPWPADWMEHWYQEARQGQWDGLRATWDQSTEAIEQPETGALIRFDNGNDTFGVGVLPDERTFITVRHCGRLVVGPISACGSLKLFRLAT